MPKQNPIAILNHPALRLVAHENGFSVSPVGNGGGHDQQSTRVVSTVMELVELLTEWGFHFVPDAPVFDVKSPHARANTIAALTVLQRNMKTTQRASDPFPGDRVAEPGDEAGRMSGTARPVSARVANDGGLFVEDGPAVVRP